MHFTLDCLIDAPFLTSMLLNWLFIWLVLAFVCLLSGCYNVVVKSSNALCARGKTRRNKKRRMKIISLQRLAHFCVMAYILLFPLVCERSLNFFDCIVHPQ